MTTATAPTRPAFGGRFVAPLFLGSMLNPINSTMIATALVPIARTFSVGAAATAWLVAMLYLASAIAQPVMGRVADRYGPRRVYLVGLAVVAAAGVGGLWVPSLAWLVGLRVLIGVGTSAAYPSAMALVRGQEQRLGRPAPGFVLGAITLGSMVSAAIGPALGGLLVGFVGWQAIFVINLPLAGIGLVLARVWLPADPPLGVRRESAWHALDLPGVIAFAAMVAVLLVFLMGLTRPNWALLGGCALLGAALVVVERRAASPFLDLRLLADNRPLLLTYLRLGLLFVVVYGMMYGFTQWLQDARGLSAEGAGLLLLPMTAVSAVCSVLGSRGRRVRGPLVIGTLALLAGTLLLLEVDVAVGIGLLIAVGVLFGVPNGLSMAGNQAALYAQAPAE
jgi:MFS family permease